MINDKDHLQFGEPQVEELKTPEKDINSKNVSYRDNTIFETPSSTQDEVQKNNNNVIQVHMRSHEVIYDVI